MSFEDEIWCFKGTEQDGADSDTPCYMDNIEKDALEKLKLFSVYHNDHDYYRVNIEGIKNIRVNAVVIKDDILEFHYYLNDEELKKLNRDIIYLGDIVENDKDIFFNFLGIEGAEVYGEES